MLLKIDNVKSEKTVKVGDILMFSGSDDLYMIIEHRGSSIGGKKYDLLSMEGEGYWTGGLSWEQVLSYAKKSKHHYSSNDFELSLVAKKQ